MGVLFFLIGVAIVVTFVIVGWKMAKRAADEDDTQTKD